MASKRSMALVMVTGVLASGMVGFTSEAMSTAAVDGNCTLTENAHISINFSGQEKDASSVKGKFDNQVSEIKKAAKDASLSKFEEQSMNYSINSRANSGDMDNGGYRFNGSASFIVEPADKAANFIDLLSKKGYKANLNVNSYRNCSPETNLLKGAIGNVVTPSVTPVPLPPYQR